jgi:ABC-type multidrug transport system ATPase subunit
MGRYGSGAWVNDSATVTVDAVRRDFGRIRALDAVSFTLQPGEFVGLIGHNGAGKTTLLRILTGQLPPSEGRVVVAGVDVQQDPYGTRKVVGYAPEQPALYGYLTAREMLTFVAQVRDADNLSEAIELAQLGDDADRLIREYSQGMRRRVALAAAILGRPQLIVLDEALNGLDPPAASRVKHALASLCAQGHTVLLSTHVLDTVERVATRVLMLAHGKLIADESTKDLGSEGLEALFLEKIGQSLTQPGDD